MKWARRAGIAAAYREGSGWSSETDPIGPAPERGSPELRASWHAAYTALRMPELDRQIRTATDRDLLAQRAAYAREAAWAPPYVARELREAYLAQARYQADAVLARHRAGAARGRAERSLAWQQAQELSALAEQVRSRRQALEEAAEARQAWHDATDQARQQALAADTELRRRHPGIGLPPMQPQHEHSADAAGPAAWPEMDDVAAPAAALEAARQARQILAERERQTCEDHLESDDLMRRREAEARREAQARRSAVRQQPMPSRRAHWQAELADLEPEARG